MRERANSLAATHPHYGGTVLVMLEAADALEAQSARITKLEDALKAYMEADESRDTDRVLLFIRAESLARRALTEGK
jgi:hypothetical protein